MFMQPGLEINFHETHAASETPAVLYSNIYFRRIDLQIIAIPTRLARWKGRLRDAPNKYELWLGVCGAVPSLRVPVCVICNKWLENV